MRKQRDGQRGQKKNTLRLQMRFNYHHDHYDDDDHQQRGAAAAPMRHKPSIEGKHQLQQHTHTHTPRAKPIRLQM